MYVRKKNGVYNVKIYVRQKNRCLQRQNLRKTKKIGVYNVGVYNVKIYVRQKNRRLQRQNLRKTKKIGVYNVKIYVRKKNWGLQRLRQRQPERYTSAETQRGNYRGRCLNQIKLYYIILY